MTKECLVALAKVMALGSAFLSLPAAASDQWAMHQANPAHTGYIPVKVNPSDIALRWRKNISTSALNPVSVAHNQIYVTVPGYFGSQYLYAIKKNGRLAWGKSFTDIFAVNPPSYADGTVYIQTVNNDGDTYLRAYKAQGGNLIFQSPHGAQWERYLSPTIYKGNVYVNGGSYGGMYSFNGAKNHENWFFGGLPQVDGWTPAVDEKRAYLYIGTLYAVDRLTGKLAFSIINSGSQAAVPLLGGRGDAFVIDGGLLSKFNTNKKKIAWQKIYGFNEGYVGQPALADHVLYAATNQGSLVALDQSTGKTLWSWKNTVKDSAQGNVVATKTHVFFATSSKLYAIDLNSHQNVWSYPVSGDLALGEGSLYVASGDGKLTAFNLGLADIFAPSSVSFPRTAANSISSKKINITNAGSKALAISAMATSNPAFTLTAPTTALTIAPNQSATVKVDFGPTSVGVVEADLTITSNDENEATTHVHLKGTGY